MAKFKVDTRAVITSVWSNCLCARGGNAASKDIKKITTVIKQASRLIGEPQESFDQSYQRALHSKLRKVQLNDTHPLHHILREATSDKSGRMLLPYAKTNRHKLSFVPHAMRLLTLT